MGYLKQLSIEAEDKLGLTTEEVMNYSASEIIEMLDQADQAGGEQANREYELSRYSTEELEAELERREYDEDVEDEDVEDTAHDSLQDVVRENGEAAMERYYG